MSDDILVKPDDAIIVPRGTQSGSAFRIDLKPILVAEARAVEVSAVTKHKAGELLRCFNEAWRIVKQHIAVQFKNRADAEKKLNETHALILLDKVPGILKEKGISSSADTREAVISLQPEYQEALENYNYINAVVAYLETKAMFFERSFQSVKKLTENNAFDFTRDHSLSGGFDEERTIKQGSSVGGFEDAFGKTEY